VWSLNKVSNFTICFVIILKLLSYMHMSAVAANHTTQLPPSSPSPISWVRPRTCYHVLRTFASSFVISFSLSLYIYIFKQHPCSQYPVKKCIKIWSLELKLGSNSYSMYNQYELFIYLDLIIKNREVPIKRYFK
jgi:hypothetical protein